MPRLTDKEWSVVYRAMSIYAEIQEDNKGFDAETQREMNEDVKLARRVITKLDKEDEQAMARAIMQTK